MQLDKTQGYIFRIKDVEQAKAVVSVLVGQGYKLQIQGWDISDYQKATARNVVVEPFEGCECVRYNPTKDSEKLYTWVDTEKFLKYSPIPKETIQVGDTIFDKEEFQQATAHLKGVKV